MRFVRPTIFAIILIALIVVVAALVVRNREPASVDVSTTVRSADTTLTIPSPTTDIPRTTATTGSSETTTPPTASPTTSPKSTVVSSAAPTSVETSTTVSVTPTSPLDLLRLEPEQQDGYDRDFFRHWIDVDRNGCDTRREVLIAESTTPVVVGSGCSITGGTWFSVYDGVTTTNASSFDIDHLVPLKEAWNSGAHSWNPAAREAFANDLSLDVSLIAVSASSNRSKSDGDPADWLPPRSSYHCTYVSSWIAVKRAWNLSVDQREYDALAAVLAGC